MESDTEFESRVLAATGMVLQHIPPGDIGQMRPAAPRCARYLPRRGREYVFALDDAGTNWRRATVLDGSSEDDPQGLRGKYMVRYVPAGTDVPVQVLVTSWAVWRQDAGFASENWAGDGALEHTLLDRWTVAHDRHGITSVAELSPPVPGGQPGAKT